MTIYPCAKSSIRTHPVTVYSILSSGL